jgi:UDP-3-O-[3-hydroxymyristoyl] glucosamine N-acyltransferase
MEFTAQQVADLLQGKVEGDSGVKVSGLSKIEEGKKGSISFLSNPLYTPYIYETDASVVILNKTLELDKPVKSTCTLIRVDDAYGSFARLLEMYHQFRANKKASSSHLIFQQALNTAATAMLLHLHTSGKM